MVDERLKNIRKEMVGLIKKKRRQLPHFSDMPYHWVPGQILNPRDGMFFTPNGAWHLIQEKLEEGHEITEIELDNPPGKSGFTMLIELETDKPPLYVKLQLGSGCVIGRSFHYSTHPKHQKTPSGEPN